MLKLKHLRHPVRTVRAAKDLAVGHWNMKRLASRGEQRFGNDARYNLQNVVNGFAFRMDVSSDDTALLERICAAYNKAVKQLPTVKQAFHETKWWQSMRRASLAPVQRALAAGDINTLRRMYQNFFRDPCSSGLVGVPLQMTKAYRGEPVKGVYQCFFLSDALHRIDYWKAQTSNRFDLRDLAGPDIGNPFGVMMDGVLVRTGTEYHHYYAHRICDLLSSHCAVVVEIGGGFGSMAYYLLRDRPAFTYIDFDVPESLALTSYYLLKSFPHLNFLLYGEEELTERSQNKFNAILMPVFELGKLPAKSIDLTFSSHAVSTLSHQAMVEYIKEIARMTRKLFLYVGEGSANIFLQELISEKYNSFHIEGTRSLEWNTMKFMKANEAEFLYQITAA